MQSRGEWCRPYYNEEEGFWENTTVTASYHAGRHAAVMGVDSLKVTVV